MKKEKIYYVYFSYEVNVPNPRGYIGQRLCKEGHIPETDPYWGSSSDESFKRNKKEKIIIETFSNIEDALELEKILHSLLNVDKDPCFANRAKQRSKKFYHDNRGAIRTVKQKNSISQKLLGNQNALGHICSPSSRAKMSEKKKGRPSWNAGIKIGKKHRKRLWFSLDSFCYFSATITELMKENPELKPSSLQRLVKGKIKKYKNLIFIKEL